MTTPNQPVKRFALAIALMCVAALFVMCGDNGSGGGGGTTPSVTISAPGIVSPNTQSPIFESQPTLTVTNATVSNGTTPTYTFQVATDSAFSSMIRNVSGIAQGSGQTSWAVDPALGNGDYFWRARADAAGTSGGFSAVAQFVIIGGGTAAGETTVVFDPLTNGSTLATAQRGGTFTPQGWRIENTSDFLRYEIPTITNGYVQWQNRGLTPRGVTDDSHMLIGMFDPTAGGFRSNPFRVNVQKLWNNPHNPPFVRLRFISQGRIEDAGFNFTDWDPGQVYTWRLDWGPAAGANTARVYLDGIEIMQIRYSRTYQPNTHFVELGIEERNESVIDAVYSNLLIVTRD